MRRLRREIEPGAVRAILDLDNPKVGIKRDFPFEPLLRLAGVDERAPYARGRRSYRRRAARPQRGTAAQVHRAWRARSGDRL